MTESFLLYTEYAEHMELLTMEQRGVLITAIFAYEMEKELPAMDPTVKMAFSFIRANLDRNREKYDAVREKRSAAGIASARAKANKREQTSTNSTSVDFVETEATKGNKREQMSTNSTVNVNVNDNVNDNDINILGGKSKRFTPPTLEEVKAYIAEKGYQVDAERFFDFYQSKGWMVGKNKMKDWRAAVRTWTKKQEPKNGYNGSNYAQRQTDYNKILGLY